MSNAAAMHPKVRRFTNPLNDAFLEAVTAFEESLRDVSDDDLNKILARQGSLSETNCGWSEYALRREVTRSVRTEQHRRRTASEDVAATAAQT